MTDSKYVLTSQRLGFRKLEAGDVLNLIKLDTDPEVKAFFPGGVSSPDELREKISRSRESFEQKGYGEFSVFELGTNEFLGRAGFSELSNGEVEVGYLFLKEHWGRGLATETLCTLLEWAGKMLPIPRILAFAPVKHGASLGVMKKAGMKYLKTDTAHGVECTFYEYPLGASDDPVESLR